MADRFGIYRVLESGKRFAPADNASRYRWTSHPPTIGFAPTKFVYALDHTSKISARGQEGG